MKKLNRILNNWAENEPKRGDRDDAMPGMAIVDKLGAPDPALSTGECEPKSEFSELEEIFERKSLFRKFRSKNAFVIELFRFVCQLLYENMASNRLKKKIFIKSNAKPKNCIRNIT